jgi:CO/xanthine dehydrogenase FAD-binding subunit
MLQLVGYHRPETLAEAVRLLDEPNRMVLAGGTAIRHSCDGEPVELVDLQALGLDQIVPRGAVLHLGATVRLQSLVDSEAVPRLIRKAAGAEQPSTLRSLATVGGTIGAADAESLLIAALLVLDATVQFADGRSDELAHVLEAGLSASGLIVGVSVSTYGDTAMATTGRTPADTPIVAAMARSTGQGIRLALTGVAATPVLAESDSLDLLEPPGDFRGSTEYRRHLATVLSARVLEELS